MLNYQRVYNVHYWSWLCIDAFPIGTTRPCEHLWEYGRHQASEHFARAPSVFEPHGRGIGDPFLTKKNGDSQERQRKLHNLTQKGNVINKHHRAWLGTCCLFLLRIYWGGSPSQQPFISKMKLSPLQQAHCSWLVMGLSPLRAHCICKNDAYRHVYPYLTMSMCLHARVCVCHKKARAPVRVRVRVRWGTLQRPMKTLQCSCVNMPVSILYSPAPGRI